MAQVRTWIKLIAIGMIMLMSLGAIALLVGGIFNAAHQYQYYDLTKDTTYLTMIMRIAFYEATFLCFKSFLGLAVVMVESRNGARNYWLYSMLYFSILLAIMCILISSYISRGIAKEIYIPLNEKWKDKYSRKYHSTEEGVTTTELPPKLPTSELFDKLQSDFECCGVNGTAYFVAHWDGQLPSSCCSGAPAQCRLADAYRRGCADPVVAFFRRDVLALAMLNGLMSAITASVGIIVCVLSFGFDPLEDD